MAEHCEVAPGAKVVGLQLTATELMVDEDCTDSDWEAVFAGVWTLAAVMVTFPAEEGAVKRPLAEMVPALADHFTAEL